NLERVRCARRIETGIDPRPVSAATRAESVERNSLNRRPKLGGDTRGTLENIERILGTIPHELCVEAVDGQRACRQRLEIHSDDWEHGGFVTIAKDGASELLTGQILLDQNWLSVVLE